MGRGDELALPIAVQDQALVTSDIGQRLDGGQGLVHAGIHG
jgi:hypothetical protein